MIQEYEELRGPPHQGDRADRRPAGQDQGPGAGTRWSRCGKEIARGVGLSTRSTGWRASCKTSTTRPVPAEDKLALAVSGWLLGPDAATTKLTHGPVGRPDPRAGAAIPHRADQAEPRSGFSHELPSEEAAAAGHAGRPAGPHEAAPRLARAGRRGNAGLLRAGSARLHRGAAGALLPPASAGVQSPPPLPDGRHAPRRRQRRPNSRSTGGPATGPAGPRRPGGARYGYIVMAPEWTGEHQKEYEYSAREHAAGAGLPTATPAGGSPSIPTACSSPAIRWAATRPGTSGWPIPTSGRA